jgi:hypothetical protein
MRRGRTNTHNPIPPPERYDYIRLAPSRVKKALEAYDQWIGKSQVPPRVKELMLVLCVEVERLDNPD